MTTGLIEVEDIPMREEDFLMKGDIPTEIGDLQEEEDHKIMEDPPIDMEDPLMDMEDHLMEEDPLMMEDLLMEMEDPQDTLIEEDLLDQ